MNHLPHIKRLRYAIDETIIIDNENNRFSKSKIVMSVLSTISAYIAGIHFTEQIDSTKISR